jgi:hypothetical protein
MEPTTDVTLGVALGVGQILHDLVEQFQRHLTRRPASLSHQLARLGLRDWKPKASEAPSELNPVQVTSIAIVDNVEQLGQVCGSGCTRDFAGGCTRGYMRGWPARAGMGQLVDVGCAVVYRVRLGPSHRQGMHVAKFFETEW